MRYKGYCANIGRTFIVDPTKVCSILQCYRLIRQVSWQEQESIYNFLLTLQSELLKTMKDGITAREVYQHAISFIKLRKPELEKNFVKNLGFGVMTCLGCDVPIT